MSIRTASVDIYLIKYKAKGAITKSIRTASVDIYPPVLITTPKPTLYSYSFC